MKKGKKITGNSKGSLQLQQLIGKGSFGQIYRAKQMPTNQLYAIKILHCDQDSDSLEAIEKQIRILMSCQHPNIVKCHSVQIVDESVWIVMDYCKFGSLADLMNKRKRAFTEEEIRFILKEILDALAYLHENQILHRDIKAANILVDQKSTIKIADFGVSTLLSQTKNGKRNTRTGSPFWMSPQLLSKSQYSFKTDIWSLGITAIELAQGAPPYSFQHPYRAIFSIQSNPPQSLSNPSQWSPEFNNFVKRCLTINDKNRPSAKKLLEDPFIKQSMTQNLSFHEELQSYEEFEGISHKGTVVLHNEKPSSLWQKSVMKQNQDFCEVSCGTFYVKESIDHEMDPQLLQNITNVQVISKQNQKKTKQSPQSQIEELYKEMEAEILQVRQKYLKKIKKVEDETFPSFEQCFKQKNSSKGWSSECEEKKKIRLKNKENLSNFKL